MIVEVYIMLQVAAIAALIATFYAKSIMPSLLTVFSSSILMIGAWILETGHTYMWNPATRAYVAQATIVHTSYLAYINMAIFGLGLLFFINDIMTIAKGGEIKSWTENIGKKEEH